MTGSRLTTWLFLSLMALTAIGAVELLYGIGAGGETSNVPVAQTDAELSEIPTANFVLPDRESLSETVERPLFMADRRLLEAPVESDPQPSRETRKPKADRYRLSAIVIVERERVALLTDTTTGSLSRVKEGERLAGWQVEEIGEDMVVLVDGTTREQLPLRTFATPPPMPRKSPRRSQPAAASEARPEAGAPDANVRRPRRPKRGPRQTSEAQEN